MKDKKPSPVMEYRLMPDPLDSRENTFTNLLLLGFQPEIYEARNKCPFNRDAFVFPNKKAMEAVFYFLFTKLNPDVARDKFRNCWPILDKKHESAFRKVAAGWLNRIRKESHDSHLPRIVASVLMSPGGDKFYQLLFYFSSYVLKEELKKVTGKQDIILPWPAESPTTKSLLNQMSKVLRAKATLETKRFLHIATLSTTAQDEWVLYASELTKENRSLRKKKREAEKFFKDLEAEHLQRGLLSPASGRVPSGGSPFAGQIKSLKRTKILQRVREFWKRLGELYQSQKILRGRINEMLNGTGKKHCLRSSDIDIKIPDLLIRECEEELYQGRIGNTYEGGKVNLLSLVQLLNLSLHLVLEQVRSNPLPSLSVEEASVRQRLHALSAYVESARSLKEILEIEMIPELKDSIDELKASVDVPETLRAQRTPKAIKNVFDLGLAGLPATPSVRLQVDPEDDSEKRAFTKRLFGNSKANTPEAVEELMKSLRDSTTIDTPQSNGHLGRSVRPPQPMNGGPKVPQKSSFKGRIPIAKAKHSNKPRASKLVANGDSNGLHIPKFGDVAPKTENQIRNGIGSKIDAEKAPNHDDITAKARELLADKVAAFVLQQRDASSQSSSSSSSRSATPMEHGLADPISAMGQDAFVPKDKIARTPSTKEKAPKQSSADPLQSYLVSSILHERTPDARTQLFPDSATNTPLVENSLFGSPLQTNAQGTGSQKSQPRIDKEIVSNKDVNRSLVQTGDAVSEPESPLFDAYLQTPLVRRAIRSSVASSILNLEDAHSFSESDEELLNTPKEKRTNTGTKLDFGTPFSYTPISHTPFSHTPISHTPVSHTPLFLHTPVSHTPVSQTPVSHAPIAKREPPNKDTSSTDTLLSMVQEESPGAKQFYRLSDTNNDKRHSPASGRFENGDKIKENYPGGLASSRTEGERTESETRRDKPTEKVGTGNASSKEQLTNLIQRFKNLKANSKKLPDYQVPVTPDPSGKVHFPDFKTRFANENGHQDESKQTFISLDNENPVSTRSSLMEMAKKSAEREAVTWADLKRSFTVEEPEDTTLRNVPDPDAHDSFENLDVPVAHQLSFLQLDTRDLSTSNRPHSAISMNASQQQRTEYEKNLSFESPFKSGTLSEREFLHNSARRDDFESLLNTSATPMSRLLDNDDFNLLTPGIDLRKRLEMFSIDFASPEHEPEGLENRELKSSPLVNLIDFQSADEGPPAN